jgi:hypothetical protein
MNVRVRNAFIAVIAVAVTTVALSAPAAVAVADAPRDGRSASASALVGRDWTASAHDNVSGGVPNVLQQSMQPFDPAPRITLPTDHGDVSFGGEPDDESYVLLGYSKLSGFSQALWSDEVALLIENSPLDVNYVFMSYGETQAEVDADIGDIKQRAMDAIAALDDEELEQHWRQHLHFVTVNPLTLGSPVSDFLMDWGASLASVHAQWIGQDGQPDQIAEMGTTDTGWAKSLDETGTITNTLAWYGGKACGDSVPQQDPTDRISLIERGDCAFTEKTINAEKHGAVAALLFTDADRPKVMMGGTCGDDCPDIPVVMIDRAPGLRLVTQLEAGRTVTATLSSIKIGVEAMAVDQQARVREFGSIPFPFNQYLPAPIDNFQMVAYEASYYNYEHERDSRLASEEAAGDTVVISLFEGEWADDPGWHGKRSYAEVELPDAETMSNFDTLELDLNLGCENNRKSNCPPWDYIVNLYICDTENPDKCDIELGRWITAYWSYGRWVTDVSPMLGYLADGGTRRFAFYSQQRYRVDLSLRLSNRDKGTTGKRAFDLGWRGGPFWNEYNKRFHPIEFEVPDWAEKVELMSYVTGHGFGKDKENCAEFCNHTHHFSINGGPDHVKAHPEAGTLMGCAEQVEEGVVPNQGGTWIYGRGGWCPGLDVKPWVIDITDEVKKGELNELVYRGLFNGEDYVPEKGPGQDPNQPYDARIRIRTFLVYSASPGVEAGPVTPPRPRIPGTIYLPTTLSKFAR